MFLFTFSHVTARYFKMPPVAPVIFPLGSTVTECLGVQLCCHLAHGCRGVDTMWVFYER